MLYQEVDNTAMKIKCSHLILDKIIKFLEN